MGVFPRIGRGTRRHRRVVQTGIVLESTQTSVARTPAHFDSAVAVTAPAEPATPKRRSREGEWAFGPGLVHLLGTVGPNDLIFNSIVAANSGYSQLWACGWLSKTMIALAIALSLALTYQSLTDLAARLLSHRAS